MQIRKIEHALYVATGVAKKSLGRLYDLRTHSIRKFFKTQLIALGVQLDYVDYMMGHTVDTYNDIQSLSIDKLRNIYSTAGLAIRAKLKVNKVDALKEIIRAWGMNPEQLLTRYALVEGVITKQEGIIDRQQAALSQELKRLIKTEATVQMLPYSSELIRPATHEYIYTANSTILFFFFFPSRIQQLTLRLPL